MNGLARCGIPLGGVGTGTVEFRSDGLFHEWQIMNNMPWGAGPAVDCPSDGAYFFMQVKESGSAGAGRSFVLCEPPEQCDFLNNPYDMAFLEHPDLKPSARFPFAKLGFKFDEAFPLRASLEAYSPFIPLCLDDSAIPAGIFDFRIKNVSKKTQTLSLGMSARNFAGYASKGNASKMAFASADGVSSLSLSRDGLAADANDAGEICVAFSCDAKSEASFVAHPLNSRSLWEPLRETGRLESRDLAGTFTYGGNAGAETIAWNSKGFAVGALCMTVELAPGESVSPRFVLSWRFPNFHDIPYEHFKQPASLLGVRYAKKFASAEAVARHVLKNAASLRKRTAAFSSAFYASDLPDWLLDAISSQLTTLRKSSWLAANGDFGIWEGLGLCGLQTTDVTYYGSFPVLQFFPELELSQMRLLVKNIVEPGKIPHSMPGNFSCGDFDDRKRKDLVPQFVLMVWRDWLWLGDKAWIEEMLPVVKQAFEFYKTYDKDGDGLPENNGPDQTYDQLPLKGVSASVGFECAASRKAAAELARAVGDDAFASECEAKAAAAVERLEKLLWTGSYYRISHDVANGSGNDGVMADQLVGDWFPRQCSGKGLVDDAKARSSAKTVMNACFQPQGYLANCSWPFGGERATIGRHTANQADWPWSGTEYAFAAQLALLGLRDEALRLCRAVFERYEKWGLRFKHIECGQHYYRVMSVWAAYLAFAGFSMDRSARSLSFDMAGGMKRFVFCDSASWGEFSVSETGLELKVRAGTLEAKELRLKNSPFKKLSTAGANCSLEGSTLVLRFAEVAKFKKGASLRCEA